MEPTLLAVKHHCVIASLCGTQRDRNLPPTDNCRSVVQCCSESAREVAPWSSMPQSRPTMIAHHQHQLWLQAEVLVSWWHSQCRSTTCSLVQCLNDLAMARRPDAPMGFPEQNTACSESTTCETVQHDLHPTSCPWLCYLLPIVTRCSDVQTLMASARAVAPEDPTLVSAQPYHNSTLSKPCSG